MERRIRHGKRMSSYEEAVMDLMARVEESERYLQRYRNSDHAVIVVGNGEEEHYPSFAIGKKKKEEAVQSIESIWQEEEDDWVLCEKTGRNTVKLTVWEWMEARRKGIINVLLLSAAFFLQQSVPFYFLPYPLSYIQISPPASVKRSPRSQSS